MNFRETFRGLRVLVTGANGFKGSWLCEWLLSEGAEVYGLGLPTTTDPSLFAQLDLGRRIHYRDVDVRHSIALSDYVQEVSPEIVFHLAAQPLVRLSYEIPVETYATNVMGTVHVLDAIRQHAARVEHPIAAVMVTTDKCYENKESLHSYRENDPMGGHDPYSSSKGACELVIQSFRKSFFNDPNQSRVAVASARAGNVIGGGDWAPNRILPDCIRALQAGLPIEVRNQKATRPWQHVLEPLSGYLLLGAELWRGLNEMSALQSDFPFTELSSAFNFGPALNSNRPVSALVLEVLKHWPGEWKEQPDPTAPHEGSLLNLATDKAHHMLGWSPRWDFETSVEMTVAWYRESEQQTGALLELTHRQMNDYHSNIM